jgi:hypothetical protein
MEPIHNIGSLDLIDFLEDRWVICLFILLFPLSIFSEDINSLVVCEHSQDDVLQINDLAGKTIKEISTDSSFGILVDVYSPSKILNCYIFIFKKDKTIHHIAANTEYRSEYRTIEEIETDKFIAIGYYEIDYSNGTKKRMFKHSCNTPFDF